MKRILQYGFFIIILYLLTFNPFLVVMRGMSSLYILLPLLLFVNVRECVDVIKTNRDIFYFYIAIITFSVFRTYMISGERGYLFRVVQQFISYALFPAIVIGLVEKYKLVFNRVVIIAILTAASITILSLIFPSFDNFITYNVQLVRDERLAESETRGFGLSAGLTFAYGFILATSVIYGYILEIGNKLPFWICVPFIAIAIIVNARTPFGILVISIILFSLLHRDYRIFKYGIYASLGMGGIILLINSGIISSSTFEWVQGFFMEIKDIVYGTNEAEHNTLGHLRASVRLPSTFEEWMVGNGKRLYGQDFISSDVGWVNQLYYGGLIYQGLLVGLAIKLTLKIKIWFWGIACGIMILVANTKGSYFETEAFRFFTMVCIYQYYKLRKTGNYDLKI